MHPQAHAAQRKKGRNDFICTRKQERHSSHADRRVTESSMDQVSDRLALEHFNRVERARPGDQSARRSLSNGPIMRGIGATNQWRSNTNRAVLEEEYSQRTNCVTGAPSENHSRERTFPTDGLQERISSLKRTPLGSCVADQRLGSLDEASSFPGTVAEGHVAKASGAGESRPALRHGCWTALTRPRPDDEGRRSPGFAKRDRRREKPPLGESACTDAADTPSRDVSKRAKDAAQSADDDDEMLCREATCSQPRREGREVGLRHSEPNLTDFLNNTNCFVGGAQRPLAEAPQGNKQLRAGTGSSWIS